MKGYVNLTHTNNSAIKEVSQKVDEMQDDYISKDTTELTNYYTKNQTYSKEEIDNKTTNVYRAKGSVQTYQDLPTEGNQVGDVYNVIEAYEDYPAGTNFVWTDTSTWDALGGEISIIQGVSQEDFDALVNNETQINTSSNGLKIGGGDCTYANAVSIGNNSSSGASGTALGYHAKCHGYLALGRGAESRNSSLAFGINAKANANRSIHFNTNIIGSHSNEIENSFQIDDDNIYKTDTHTLTVQNAEINGTPAYGVLSGTLAPTTTTVGAVGQFYLDTTNKQLYQCVSLQTQTVDEVDTTTYEWQEVGGSSEKKYMHCLIVEGFSTPKVFVNIITDNNEPMTNKSELINWLKENGYVTTSSSVTNIGYPATGGWYTGTDRCFYDAVYVDKFDRLCARQIELGVVQLKIDDIEYYTLNNNESFILSGYAGGGFNDSLVDTVIEI